MGAKAPIVSKPHTEDFNGSRKPQRTFSFARQ